MIPDHIATRYESAVKGAARDVYKAYGHIYGKRALVAEAWGIAAGRWEVWETSGFSNPPGYARTDIRFRLYSWCQGNAKAMGWEGYTTQEGKRRYREMELPTFDADFFSKVVIESTLGIPGAELMGAEVNLDVPIRIQLPMGWPLMTVREALTFAAILFRDHIEVCADFYRLYLQAKPPKRSQDRWEKSQEVKRATLRVKWSQEIAEAMFETFHGQKPPRDLKSLSAYRIASLT